MSWHSKGDRERWNAGEDAADEQLLGPGVRVPLFTLVLWCASQLTLLAVYPLAGAFGVLTTGIYIVRGIRQAKDDES